MLTNLQAIRAEHILARLIHFSFTPVRHHEDVIQDSLLRMVEYGPIKDEELDVSCRRALKAAASKSWRVRAADKVMSSYERVRLEGVRGTAVTDDAAVNALDAAECFAVVEQALGIDELEMKIALGVAEGERRDDIAKRLSVSRQTVWNLWKRLLTRAAEAGQKFHKYTDMFSVV